MSRERWYIGDEDRYYGEPRDAACPCSEAGLLECFCGGPVTPDDARDWLRAHGVEADTLHHVEVIVAVEEAHPNGWPGFWDECAAEKAARSLGLTDYAAIVAKARAAA